MRRINRHSLLPLAILLCIAAAIGCSGEKSEQADPPATTAQVDPPPPTQDSGKKRGTIEFDPARSYPGYNLYTIRDLATAALVTNDGQLIQRWEGQSGRWGRCMLLPDGDVVIVGLDDLGRYIMRVSWHGELRWRYNLPVHHDVSLSPDGRMTTLAFQNVRAPQVSEVPVRDDVVAIISEDGSVAAQLSLFSVMTQAGFAFQKVKPSGEDVNLFNANTVRWMTHDALDGTSPIHQKRNVIVSIRHQNTVAVFDFAKREMLWAWGQGVISGPRDAQFLDNGNLLIFDNGVGRGWSRVIELDPLTETIVWEYKAPNPKSFYTPGGGANQRLPNGNTLITQSDRGLAFEVTPDGEKVWEYRSPAVNKKGQNAVLARLYRYDLDMVDRILSEN